MFEILIAITLMVVVGFITIPNLRGKRGTTELDAAVRQIAALLREAQSAALAGDSESNWGVHFENNPDGPFYALFKSSYGPGNIRTRGTLPNMVSYGSISPGNSEDIVFEQVTGRPLSVPVPDISLALTGGGTATISVSASGAVSF
ncbi:MAG: hypothetical protein A2946_03275 [Candidatus Liptonbacteria bacterium RIFCSPLOWO2_01_FULL_53_13]|uniref:General secretion pathway GspH domain-containing protein n=1 Tax=Candidatus Liptonbacteria bacterium RIFCSPLOWO2_01_FULL_53_13 TaxID=1798651 RepID=A0A1G2CIK4_9BACT|nr:MAG: hypothetical protein A2946_03275 [Candidatus Liptonbacteria bacterium RIFCSPLOWO2_01_FULL_53_13]